MNKSTTPITSPRAPYSVGQNYPPKGSPNRRSARAPSPNYFGLVIDPSAEGHDSSAPGKDNWSPAGSSIKSFAAALPMTVPLEPNSDFEAFRKQVDRNRGPSFALPTTSHVPSASTHMVRPRPTRWHSHTHEATSEPSSFRLALNRIRADIGPVPGKKPEADQTSLHDSAYVSLDSKRNSDASLMPPQIAAPPRVASPLPIEESEPQPPRPEQNGHHEQKQQYQPEEYSRDDRLSLNEPKPRRPSPSIGPLARASTLPMKFGLDIQSPHIPGDQLVNMLETFDMDGVLLLDVRSVQNFAQNRIKHALNLCIPTTLLKRATFGIEKLQQTFQESITNSAKFNRWRDMQWIIVYDTNASDSRDSMTAHNMVKKFTAANYSGKIAILRGGFSHFRQAFPDWVDNETMEPPPPKSENATLGSNAVAPVIGGVMLPSSMHEPNPFFSNIRQNMDLADGVGQFDVHLPEGVETSSLPSWLREACAPEDHGKKVSDRFLHIEREEQSRMKGAYAAFNPSNCQSNTVQLCGVEKGVKNRYKDILPFEHSRVRLENKPSGSCDYVNASNLSASRTNKKYIATQGPLPATFEDFWSVVWDQDVRVIVMLTATTEGGQLKCHPYWEEREFGPIKLRPLSEKKASLDMEKYRSDSSSTPSSTSSERGRRRANTTTAFEAAPNFSPTEETPYVVIRKFALSHSSHPFAPMREITHLHFPGWPDFGTPAKPSHLLALVELANVMQRAALPVETSAVVESHKSGGSLPITWHDEPEADKNCRPMLVHCSAGCGRTGAFCTVDSVVDMLKRKRQAELTGITAKDTEGDVSMFNPAAEGVSPMTAGDSYFQMGMSSVADSVASLPHSSQDPAASLETRWLNDDSVDLIQTTVEDFRQQRLSTVQSLRQYVLCYETVLEWMHCMQEKTASTMAGRKRSGSLTLTLPH